ncbi:MAG TPA: tetratricopeptide repeat protein [Candidatus Krumholzibacteriaceae bacterium]|nr:tetratricopeptide repeat protein [Candidatus Krumholzibacteriaceae bacterium]
MIFPAEKISIDIRDFLRAAGAVLILAAVFMIIPLSHCGAVLSSEELQNDLEAAQEAFQNGLEHEESNPQAARDYFRSSILHYRRMIDEGGVRNGKIYYNIGNAYFRLNDLGRAILNYKRSALYIPNDDNLTRNLKYARSRRKNKIEEKERERVLKTLFFLHYDLPYSVRFIVFSVFFALVWLAASVYIFVRSGKLKIVIVLFAVLCGAFFTSLMIEKINFTTSPEGVIIVDDTVARKGDAETYQPSFTDPLSAGTEFELIEDRGRWWQIELVNGERCWIESNAGETVIE